MADNHLNGFRTASFWVLSGVILTVVLLADWFDWCDAALLSYALTGSISIICALMFADWWRLKGGASSIYKWITILLFSITLNDAFQVATRFTYIYFHGNYEHLIDSSWWKYRSFPKLLALIYLLSFAIWQRWGRLSTIHDGIRDDMAEGFKVMEARIVAGEVRFEGHTHDGLILGAKLIIKPLNENGKP